MERNSQYIPEPLWSHQREALERANGRFGLFFDPGTGKTRTAIELYSKASALVRNAIIFAPLNVCRNWVSELNKYLPLDKEIYLVAGQSKGKKIKTLQEFITASNLRDPNVHNFLICNTETLRSREYLKLIVQCNCQFIICDESHFFKSESSAQTKGLFLVEQVLKPQWLYLLTGTPAPQGEIDLWSTFKLLKQTNDNFFIWRKKHFEDRNERRRGTANYWPDYQITQSSRVAFRQILDRCSMTAKKDEVLDLPELLRLKLYTTMSKEQARHYETMKEYLFAIDENGNELNAANMLVRTLRLQQILAGFIGNIPIKDNPRTKTLLEAVALTGGEQFIIWTIFQPTYNELSDLLMEQGITHGFLTGEQSAEERHNYMDDFQAGGLRALVAHPKAGGIGVNLTAASYSIHYTRSFSLTDDLQAEARNYRGGSERHKRITRIDIITPDTIDEDISEALRAKKSVQDFILGLKEKHGRN